jgi:homoserine kinase type II
MSDAPRRVLAAYGITSPPAGVRDLGAAGGFSGARFWKITDPRGTFCLRRWPVEYPTCERLTWIHAVLHHVARVGFTRLPLPRPTRAGATWVEHEGQLWELTPWMPGEANFHRSPRPEKLAAALHALAEFHLAAASFPGGTGYGNSPGVLQRLERIEHWLNGGLERLVEAMTPSIWPELYPRAGRVFDGVRARAGSVRLALARAAELRVALQPCIRDVWHDHLLFQGDTVSGVVDFGSMASDTVACDIGRLLGSLARDDAERWNAGVAAYQQIRPMGEAELELVNCFDRSTIVLGGLNWLQWIYGENRQFSDPAAVLRRIDEILARLEWRRDSGGWLGGRGGDDLP